MSFRFVPDHIKAAAAEDYHTSDDSKTAVAARHGISRTTLSDALDANTDGIEYIGGWELRGGVKYPLLPERRSA